MENMYMYTDSRVKTKGRLQGKRNWNKRETEEKFIDGKDDRKERESKMGLKER